MPSEAHLRAADLAELGGRPAENWPFTAIRLDNGNTLIGGGNGHCVLEVTPQKKVVWTLNEKRTICLVQILP